MRSNGEVEGPPRSAGFDPRARNFFPRPRRHYRLSRTPPTIVRRRHQLIAPHVTLPESEASNEQRNAAQRGYQIDIGSDASRLTPSERRKDCERFEGMRQRHDPETDKAKTL